ncbi:PilZ domain-containing protein [Thiogranum longum]|uniref:PilZ domain-containing protein n=1 Tax=Thiogranum longum TaxID=1537524 RepID=A0A4R1H8Z5_9GAMM|nr:PilZ domain-containing protein [Thiogranum longum]TCK18317.1 PilZ domain-containing protein [Thiogranum longum]
MERRKAKRDQILVDIDIAHPGAGYCHGHVENISKGGVSVHVDEGELPAAQRSVILNMRVWTGNEILYRKMYCRVVRHNSSRLAMEFAENDIVTEAIIQDLMFYQKRGQRHEQEKQVATGSFANALPEPAGS